MTGDLTAWLRRFDVASGADRRLVCFPHAGGTAKYFRPYWRALSGAADVIAVQYPGRQERSHEPPIGDLEELARPAVDAVLELSDRPLTLFGHSMGAALAFEVARRLEAKGVVLSGLFVSGRRAPSRHRDERTHQLADPWLLHAVRGLAGPSAELPGFEVFARKTLPLIRVDYKAAETYRYVPGPRLSCPVVALTGDADPLVTVDEAAAWAGHTDGPFDLRVYPGGHFYLDEHRPALIELLSAHLSDGA
ncbi:MAG TPA: alpha/beta fold hydrolase [Actinophytocola sp.]|jgi:surfactin synthase thioesterase subunit|uniref:thioesterase II family protein n=1 Tax=Actinophytocola sp. TaxID=1872138 RepID=UPI002F94A656